MEASDIECLICASRRQSQLPEDLDVLARAMARSCGAELFIAAVWEGSEGLRAVE